MEKLSELMKDVSLKNYDQIGDAEVKNNELIIVTYKDDAHKPFSNRKVDVAGSLMQLDAILCYVERDRDQVFRVKIVEEYSS